MSNHVGRNEPCPCGSGRKYKKCCIDRGAGGLDAEPQVAPSPRGEITLLIETPRGVMARIIPSASPLSTGMRHGYAAEAATHDAAALWGLPDFVYLPETAAVASGTRELGDGLLVVGDLGVVVQVKSRENPTSDADKERRWLEKKTAEAIRQGNGTIRQLKERTRRLTNLRNRSVDIDGNAHRWIVVVVLDHNEPPQDSTPPLDEAKHPTVVLLRRDWEFLFDQLKSTHAVAEYFERVAGEAIPLGDEPLRYTTTARISVSLLTDSGYGRPVMRVPPRGTRSVAAARSLAPKPRAWHRDNPAPWPRPQSKTVYCYSCFVERPGGPCPHGCSVSGPRLDW